MPDDLLSNNDRNLVDQAPGRSRFAASCLHRCKFRTGAKTKDLPPEKSELASAEPMEGKSFLWHALLARQRSHLARYGPDLVQGIPGATATRLISRSSERHFAHAVISNIHS